MLDLEDVQVYRDRTHVLRGLTLSVGSGEVVALIGANGAGKSTTLLAISGLLPIAAGSARFVQSGEALDLRRARPAEIVRAGLVHAPEGRQIFGRLSVEENLELGAWLVASPARERALRERVYALFPVLGKRRIQRAGSLSGGEQTMLALGRALMAEPNLLLLDEPSLGLAPRAAEEVFELIATINRDFGVPVLLVEQNAMLALEIAQRAYVIETGRIVRSDDAETLLHDPEIGEAYLGISG